MCRRRVASRGSQRVAMVAGSWELSRDVRDEIAHFQRLGVPRYMLFRSAKLWPLVGSYKQVSRLNFFFSASHSGLAHNGSAQPHTRRTEGEKKKNELAAHSAAARGAVLYKQAVFLLHCYRAPKAHPRWLLPVRQVQGRLWRERARKTKPTFDIF